MSRGECDNLGEATLESYLNTRRTLLEKADELSRTIAALEPVRELGTMNEILRLEKDRRIVIGMISSCSYTIDWLETGGRPGHRRGMERRAGYQRELPVDPCKLKCGQPFPVEELPACEMDMLYRRFRIEAGLHGLTDRERDCYVLAHGEGYSYADIALLLEISKSSVSTYMLRAQRKVKLNVNALDVQVG